MGHPAHYHNFKNSIESLERKGHEVKILVRAKDVLLELIEEDKLDVEYLPPRENQSKMGLVFSILKREWKLLRMCVPWKPDLLIGTDLVITHIGKLLGIRSVVVNEDDSSAVPLMARYAFPFATHILAPNCCDQSPSNHKKIGYEGYHELAYLHPDYFTPVKSLLPLELRSAEKYFILRFAALNAHHDDGRSGIHDELALKLIEILEPHGSVFITSERKFSERLEKYRIPIHPKIIHHAMAFAEMYIGDSQTMAAEAAVLGVPSIRFNDFVGELNYLEELETRYQLTVGIQTSQQSKLIELTKKWVELPYLKDEWSERRKRMLANTISVTPFWVETFENVAVKTR
jgi:predicted glycosyltransferase